MDDEALARVAHALGHPARVRILRLLAAQDSCRGRAVFSEVPLAQSTISQHLAVLKNAGLIHASRMGTAQVYCITPQALTDLGSWISALKSDHPVCAGEEEA